MNSLSRVPAGRRRASRRWRPAPHASTSTHHLAVVRRALLAGAGIVVGGLTLGSALAGQAIPSVTPAALDGAALSIQLVPHEALAPGLEEVRIGAASTGTPAEATNRLLAVAPDGAAAAIASQIGPGPAALILAGRDGTRRSVEMPGLIGAAFAPDGSWLAVIDGAGSIWRLPAGDLAASRMADGPFIGSPVVDADGSVLALRVSSIEAPIVSHLMRIAPDGSLATLADDDLVYGAQLMADGSIAYVAHHGSGTVLKQLVGGKPRQLADLGEDAVNVVLGPNQDEVAFERSGQVFVRLIGQRVDVPVGAGARPHFAPDGHSLLVERASGSVLLSLDGTQLGQFDGQTGFGACAAGCQP